MTSLFTTPSTPSISSRISDDATADVWKGVDDDVKWLDGAKLKAEGLGKALAMLRLWQSSAPAWAEMAWDGLKVMLRSEGLESGVIYVTGMTGGWRVEKNGFSVDTSTAAALDIRIATQPDAWWKRGPAAVNRDIAEWVEGARLGEPREPNVSGFIVRLLASREGQFTIGEIREAFAEANYDVIDKTMRGQLSRLASEGKIWRVATGVYQAPLVLSAGVVPDGTNAGAIAEPWVEPIVTLDDQPNGFTFKEADNQLVITASGNETDAEAARDPVTRHLHAEAARRASDFAAVGGKLDNQIGWQGMGLAASRSRRFCPRTRSDGCGALQKLGPMWLSLGRSSNKTTPSSRALRHLPMRWMQKCIASLKASSQSPRPMCGAIQPLPRWNGSRGVQDGAGFAAAGPIDNRGSPAERAAQQK